MKKISLVLVIILICSTLGCAFTGIAFADSETVYTDVLEDMSKDETFDAGQYPAKADDYSLTVFQIAESNAGELFLYVYQPAEDTVTASEVRISTSIGDNLSPKDYKLTLLSRNGTLAKYKVDDLKVLSDVVRYYVIVQIARPFNSEFDEENSKYNDANTVVYAVGRLFSAETTDGAITYMVTNEESILITAKYVGNLRYYDGGTWGEEYYTSSHYVAFSTDIQIDKIYEVDVDYVLHKYIGVLESDYKNWEEALKSHYEEPNSSSSISVTLKSEEYASNNNHWAFLPTHTWKKIQSIESFKSTEKLTDSALEKLKDKQWVLRFATTDIKRVYLGALMGYSYNFSEVSNVTILRLKYLSNGKTYNLGVIDNKQTGGSVTKPDNNGTIADKLQNILDNTERFFSWFVANWWAIVVGAVVIAVVTALIIAIVKKGAAVVFTAIGKAIWFAIKYLFVGIGYVVASPVLIVMAIVRAAKKNKQ